VAPRNGCERTEIPSARHAAATWPTLAAMAEWVSVSDAARLAAVSDRTMRRWVTGGQVRSQRRGRAYLVDASELAATSGQDGQPLADNRPPSAAMADEAPHLAELVRELTAKLADVSASAALWQGRADVLAQRLHQLEAPKEPDPVPTPAPSPPTPNGPEPHGWWPRFRLWLSGA
jgi:Helix-turn-helix domain